MGSSPEKSPFEKREMPPPGSVEEKLKATNKLEKELLEAEKGKSRMSMDLTAEAEAALKGKPNKEDLEKLRRAAEEAAEKAKDKPEIVQ